MSNLSNKDLVSLYCSFMDHVKFRLETLKSAINSANEQKESDERRRREYSIVMAELCYLQVRKICETTALATLVAHNQLPTAASNKFTKNYNADAILGMLAKLNENGFPLALRELPESNDGDRKLEFITDGIIGRKDLKQIYNRCHVVLHQGNLRDIIEKKEVKLDFQELTKFHNQFAELLKHHLVPLPEFEKVLICILHPKDTGECQAVLLAAKPLPGETVDHFSQAKCSHLSWSLHGSTTYTKKELILKASTIISAGDAIKRLILEDCSMA